MDNKKSFLMYYEYEEQLADFTDAELGQLIRAIFKYEKLGLEPENLGSLQKMAFGFIKGNLNRDREKYDRRTETSVINGKKGGRPKKIKPNEKPNEKPKKPKKAVIDIVTDIDTVIDNDIEIVTVIDYIEQNYGRTISPIECEEVLEWQDSFSDDIIKYAVKISVVNNAKSFSYVDAILNSWHDKGFKTLEECKNEKKSDKPEWYGETIDEKTASEEEIKELEARLNGSK